jgi:hypothetical protein
LGTQRETPSLVLTQIALPPLQQFCDAPRPPQTSPSATQVLPPVFGPVELQRRTPSASAVPHDPVQHSRFEVQTSLTGRQPHIG